MAVGQYHVILLLLGLNSFAAFLLSIGLMSVAKQLRILNARDDRKN